MLRHLEFVRIVIKVRYYKAIWMIGEVKKHIKTDKMGLSIMDAVSKKHEDFHSDKLNEVKNIV